MFFSFDKDMMGFETFSVKSKQDTSESIKIKRLMKY